MSEARSAATTPPRLEIPRLLIGPLMRPYLLGPWIEHAEILPFYYPAGVERYHAGVMEPEFYRFPAHCLKLDLSPVGAGSPSLAALWEQLPPGFVPELLIWWGFFAPLPADIAACPVPSLLIVSDWHGCLGAVRDYLEAFDAVLADRALLRQLSGTPLAARSSYWPSYAWDPEQLAGPESARDIDVCFVGNLNPAQYRARNRLLARLAAHAPERLYVGQRQYGREYAGLLRRSKIAFNHALRGEMNLRAYEAAACGALLFQEAGNLESEDFLPDREASVHYTPDTLCELVDYYLEHEDERMRLARRGQELIAAHSFGQQFADLLGRLPAILADIAAGKSRKPAPLHDPGRLGPLLQARHLSRVFLPETLAGAVAVLRPAAEASQASPDAADAADTGRFGNRDFASGDFGSIEAIAAMDPMRRHALAICLAHAAQSFGPLQGAAGLASLGAGQSGPMRAGLEWAAALLAPLAAVSKGDDWVLPALNLAWVHWFRQDPGAAGPVLGQAMARLSAPDFELGALAAWADFVLPLGFCSFAQDYERLPERYTQQALASARRELLLWNGLLLQGQLSARQGPAQALPYFEAAAGLLPDLPDAWLAAGQLQLLLAAGQEAENKAALMAALTAALDLLETGLARGGIFPWVYQALIQLCLRLDRLPEARRHLAAASALFHGPGTESVRQALDQLRRALDQHEGQDGFLGT